MRGRNWGLKVLDGHFSKPKKVFKSPKKKRWFGSSIILLSLDEVM